MKKIFLALGFSFLLVLWVFAYDTIDLQSANYLAGKWYIVDNSSAPDSYRLWDSITRKEIMKVIAKIGWAVPVDNCSGKFSDVGSDWGCKYIEWALGQGIIAANPTFRPDDNITKAEAIKMILKVKNIANTYNGGVWQENYMGTAYDKCIVSSTKNYNQNAQRSFIFNAAYSSENTTICDPNAEIDNILKDLTGIL